MPQKGFSAPVHCKETEPAMTNRSKTAKKPAFRNSQLVWLLSPALLLLLAVVPALGQGPALEFEFSLVPGENGVPDFGRPAFAVASPDGHHLYVTSFPPFHALLTFERVGQDLVLRDTITNGDDGLDFGLGTLDITSDGAYVLLASGIAPAAVLVFTRDQDSGLLSHAQTVEHPKLSLVDGVAAGTGALVWGRPAFPETGGTLLYLDRSDPPATEASLARIGSQISSAGAESMPLQPEEAIDLPAPILSGSVSVAQPLPGRDSYAVFDSSTVTVSLSTPTDTTTCSFSIEVWTEALGLDPENLENAALNHSVGDSLLILNFAGGDQVYTTLDPNICALSNPDFLLVEEPFRTTRHNYTEVRRGDSGATVARNTRWYYLELGERDEETVAKVSLWDIALSGNLPADPIFYENSFPVQGVNHLTSSDMLSPNVLVPESSRRSSNTERTVVNDQRQQAFVYATVPEPPAILAYLLSDDPLEEPGCNPSTSTACPNGFPARITWEDFQGNTGSGRVVAGDSSDSSLFWLFNVNNWELLLKVLDGCAINGHFWVFYAATTNVGFELTIENPSDPGQSRVYSNPLGQLAATETDTFAFACTDPQITAATSRGHRQPLLLGQQILEAEIEFLNSRGTTGHTAGPTSTVNFEQANCTDSTSVLCLTPDRFQAEVSWRDFQGNTGVGQVVPLRSTDSGLFWFFNSDNWEMLVKVLDGCASNQHFWLLAAATTDVEYELNVTDTQTGETFLARNEAGTPAKAIIDVEAFASGCS